jgi:hypothetical protein
MKALAVFEGTKKAFIVPLQDHFIGKASQVMGCVQNYPQSRGFMQLTNTGPPADVIAIGSLHDV